MGADGGIAAGYIGGPEIPAVASRAQSSGTDGSPTAPLDVNNAKFGIQDQLFFILQDLPFFFVNLLMRYFRV